MPHTKQIGMCLCGNKASKWKLSSWCCDRCDKIEETGRYRKNEKQITRKRIDSDPLYHWTLKA